MNTLDLLQTGQLTGTRRLDLACGLTQVPPAIFDLADSLEILNLSHNCLRELPPEFARLQHLKILFLSQNLFETLPEVLGQCRQLEMIGVKANRLTTVPPQALPPQTRWLILTDNQLETLPDRLGDLPRLQKLMLAGNRLRSLPSTLAACPNLELVRISANQLPELPPWLLTLPRLAWLAYGGNPFCPAPPPAPALSQIAWNDLTLGEVLGEGASGVIYRGLWHTAAGPQPVAIKLFKGAVTSDGFPADELQTCMAAGHHPNLVQLLGRLHLTPDHQDGLVFTLIPPDYQPLGLPPSFETCTRDTYAQDTVFSLARVGQIARGIASVAAHLHDRGILHGDLYAHNIQCHRDGHSLLGDFGAACFYDPSDTDQALALERLEVRAFGHLLTELLDHCPVTGTQINDFQVLRQLQQACLDPLPAQRPRFKCISKQLTDLASSFYAESG